MDSIDTPEGRGNPGGNACSPFHPSRPPSSARLLCRKPLLLLLNSAQDVGRALTHLGNPGWSLRVSIVGPASQPEAADYERSAGGSLFPYSGEPDEVRLRTGRARAGS
jgi:hypothetical protein